MTRPWENDSCETVQSYYSAYYIPQAAALWCKVPPAEVQQVLENAIEVGRNIYGHPSIPCLEPRCRAIHDAIDNDKLRCGRDGRGRNLESEDHVAPERRTVTRHDLKEWIAREFPGDKPPFLFDETERQTHSAISADAYRALKAEHDKLASRLENAKAEFKKLREEKETIEAERDSLKAMVNKLGTLGDRAESTYQNIIAALLDCIAGNLPDVEKHPSFSSEAKLIEAIDAHYRGYGGLTKSTLSRKFPEAKRALHSR